MLEFLIGLLGKWYIWAPIAATLGYLAFRNQQRAKLIAHMKHVLLAVEFPKSNTKNETSAEEFFSSLHGMLRNRRELAKQGGLQEHISFEITATGAGIKYFLWIPTYLQNFVEGQLLAQYPDAKLYVVEKDYTDIPSPSATYTAEIGLNDSHLLPIKTHSSFTSDPLDAVRSAMSTIGPEEQIWLQLLVRPIASDWHTSANRAANRLKNGQGGSVGANVGLYLLDIVEAMWRPPKGRSTPEPSERNKARIEAIGQKRSKLGFQIKLRLTYVAPTAAAAKNNLHTVANAFKQFDKTHLNGLGIKKGTYASDGLAEYRARFFIDKGFILNSEELATLYHFPYSHTKSKDEPPIIEDAPKPSDVSSNLPILSGPKADADISAFGLTTQSDKSSKTGAEQFGIFRNDRSRHMYVIGQTGTGKTALLELLALSDVFHNQGYAIIDPHGDFAASNLRYIPSWRTKDVIYFNPADTANPIGFNPMEVINPAMKSVISSEVIGVLKRMFGDSWGPRLEHILRFTILALLDYPHTTLLDITRMLTDKNFREAVLKHCDDTVVLQFWRSEFATWNDRFAAEAIAPVLNKVGAFTANPIIRNIIGQPKSTFNIREIMDSGKILIVNLSKGLIGEDNAAILGSFLVTKIQLAAMSRSDIPRVENRRPFYLYVDEFQNFATDSFATILSEARKYGLNLTLANQYVSQMAPSVRDAVFGNVGTLISFRLSADDAPVLRKQFEPQFNSVDLMQLHSRHFLISMVVNEEKIPPFAGTTLSLPPVQADLSEQIIQHTRHTHATPRVDVEKYIHQQIEKGSPTPYHHHSSSKQRYLHQPKPTHSNHSSEFESKEFIVRVPK